MVQSSDKENPCLKQVEINTISCSFGGLAPRVSKLHSHICHLLDKKEFENLTAIELEKRVLPENHVDVKTAETMAECWKLYAQKDAIIVYVVQEREKNKYDQLHVHYELTSRFKIKVVRKTMTEMDQCTVDSDGRLILSGEEIAVVYYRAGYGPNDYPSQKLWDVRKKIELSMAIKIPTIPWQLAGTKKVQQLLSNDEILKKFTKNVELISKSFVALHELTDAAVKNAIDRCEDYVLKPQREGGGNNFYGEQMKEKLLTMKQDEKDAYILMELIKSEAFENYVFRNGEILKGNCVTEFGVFSGFIANGTTNKQLYNECLGQVLRTKLSHMTESGVSAGFGALDSPVLYSQ